MTQINNEFGITKEKYQDEFVMKLAKAPELIFSCFVSAQAFKEFTEEEYDAALAKFHLIHMVWGVAGEAFELNDVCINNETAQGTFIEEVGDSLFYAVGMFPYLKLEGYWYDYLPSDHVDSDLQMFMTVAGEVLDQAKKYVIYDKADKFTDVQEAWKTYMLHLKTAIEFEIGDIQSVIDHNVTKLAKRYAGLVYSDLAAIQRADKIESFDEACKESVNFE